MALDVRNLARLLKGLRPNPHVRRTRNIRVPMDDGVTLETEHFAPVAPGPHPTVLTRVPYGIVGFRGDGASTTPSTASTSCCRPAAAPRDRRASSNR